MIEITELCIINTTTTPTTSYEEADQFQGVYQNLGNDSNGNAVYFPMNFIYNIEFAIVKNNTIKRWEFLNLSELPTIDSEGVVSISGVTSVQAFQDKTSSTSGTDLGDYDSDAPGFFEDLIPSIKTIMVRDDRGKAEIIARSYKDDSRFGGVFEDKFGLPLIMWNNRPYYINKPGMTTVDLSTVLGDLIKFLPATKLIGTGTTLNRASKAIPLTGGTEVLSQVLESQLAPKTTEVKTQSGERTASSIAQDVGTSTAIGVGAEIALPVVGGLVRRTAQSLGKVSPQVVKIFFQN